MNGLGTVQGMSSVHWHERPSLRRPVAVLAFEGWNDAGDAASETVRWLSSRTDAEPIARIDAEEFFDFTVTRPELVRDDDGDRTIRWPDTEIWAATLDGDRDAIFVLGPEPHLRWQAWSELVLGLLDELDVSLTVLLGSLLADLPHTLPSRVSGTTDDSDLRRRLDLRSSNYEGPTGITGVLAETLPRRDRQSVSLWAAVPNYIGAPDPKAQLALVERTTRLLGLSFPVTDLEIAVASYERQLEQLLDDDPDLAAYIGDLEERAARLDGPDADGPNDLASTDPHELVQEVERFLRGD